MEQEQYTTGNSRKLITYSRTFHRIKSELLAMKWGIDLHVEGKQKFKKKMDKLAKLLFDIERDMNDKN